MHHCKLKTQSDLNNKCMMEIKIIDFSSNEYRQELELRDAVLRKPLGMSIYNDFIDNEKDDTHIGAFENGKLTGVLILTKLNRKEIKMRQFAVDERFRNQKTGSQLVAFAENFCKSGGFGKIILNARKSAAGFYQKLGYLIVSDEFTEVGIPHYRMEKVISEC